MYSSSIANKVYCLNKKLVYTFILIYPLLFSNLVLALNLPLIQDGGLTPVTAPPNYLYSKIEIGDYKNYCEYGNMPIAFSTYSLNILTVYTQIQSTNTPSIIGCMPIVNNNNEAAYRYLRFELIDKDNSCPSIKMESVNPIGDIPIDSPNVKISNQSFYHGYNEDEIYAPKIGYGNKELNYCYYLLQLLNTNRENANDKVVYFHLYPSNLDVFVKGDNYSQQYTKKNIDGINYFTSDLYEPIDKYYRLPKMDLGYFEQNNISKYWKNEDFNFNKGKYLSTNTKETNGKVEASNVMFFPGVLGSQLFQTEPYSTSTAMVWPSFSTASQIKMRISNPERIYDSTNYINPSNIHAYNDVKSIVDGGVTKTIGTLDIYKSFLDELDSLQSSNQIADYSAIPYDFRLSTDDIYCNVSMYFGIDKSRVYYDTRSNRSTSNYSKCYNSYIYGELKRLVLSSKTGHVTLIGHSYGGLVIKEILKQLEDTHDPLIGSIDKVILVAVPQAGSPEAVVSLLHGVDIGMLGYPMTAEVERDLALTFPSSYQILPNDSLIKSISNSGVNIISFKNKDLLVATSSPSDYSKSIKAYGLTIDTASELYSYILAKDNRVYATSTSDLHRAAKGISQLMDHIITEKEKLDNYVPTSTIQVTQIAGWGIPTDIGYSYDYTDPKSCTQYMATNTMMSSTPNYNCVNVGPSPLLHVTRSRNGDDTVTVPSALWMDTASHTNVKNLWVDLEAVNQTKLVIFDTHKNIFSIRSLQNVIVSILKGHITNEKYIYNKAPEYINAKTNSYITYTIHSPVYLSLTDVNGITVTSTSTDSIPGVYFKVIGDTKIISVTSDLPHTINLQGYTNGVYSLDVNTQDNNDIVTSSTSFTSIPTTPVSEAKINYIPNVTNTNSSLIQLLIDLNGNGKVDAIITSTSTSQTYTAASTVSDTKTFKEIMNSIPTTTIATTVPSYRYHDPSTIHLSTSTSKILPILIPIDPPPSPLNKINSKMELIQSTK